nr:MULTISPECIES: LD-carboxypeptidase [unclassified Fibrobacter]
MTNTLPTSTSQTSTTLKSWGLTVIEASNLYSSAEEGRYSGTLDERADAMQALIDNKSVKAIFFARGGYGSSQLLNKLNYSKLEKHPKWFVGYSDITAFHIALNNLGFETIQGPMMKGFNKDSRPERHQLYSFHRRNHPKVFWRS